MKEDLKFAANRNKGTLALLWAALICCLALIVYMSKDKAPFDFMLICILCAAAAVAAYFLLRAFYVFKQDCILSVFGPYRDRFYFSKITLVKLAPPQRGALQGVRLAVFYGDSLKGYICPRDIKGFIAKVKKYIPNAEIQA